MGTVVEQCPHSVGTDRPCPTRTRSLALGDGFAVTGRAGTTGTTRRRSMEPP